MTTICADLIETSDYLHTATEIRIVIAGRKGEWSAKIRGTSEDGAEVGVAYYDGGPYETKALATQKARLMFAHVKNLRAAAGS